MVVCNNGVACQNWLLFVSIGYWLAFLVVYIGILCFNLALLIDFVCCILRMYLKVIKEI